MSLDERYEGNFLEGLDLPESAVVTAVIMSVTQPGSDKDASGKLIDKAIIEFDPDKWSCRYDKKYDGAKTQPRPIVKQKRLIVGKNSYLALKAMYGSDDTEWLGEPVTLQRRYLEASKAFGKHNTPCVRIIVPDGTPVSKTYRDYVGSKKPIKLT